MYDRNIQRKLQSYTWLNQRDVTTHTTLLHKFLLNYPSPNQTPKQTATKRDRLACAYTRQLKKVISCMFLI